MKEILKNTIIKNILEDILEKIKIKYRKHIRINN